MNNTSWSTDDEVSFLHRLAGVILFQALAWVGFIFNATALYLTFRTDLYRNDVNLLIANQSFADFMTSCLTICLQSYYILNVQLWDGPGCAWTGYVQFVITFESVIFISMLAVNRYISLYNNLLYSRLYSKVGIALIIAISWLFVICVVTPYKFGNMTGFDRDNMHCCVIYSRNLFWDAYYLVGTFTPVVIADCVTLYANFKIYRFLKTHVENSSLVKCKVRAEYRNVQLYTVLEIMIPLILLLPYYIVKYAYADRSIYWTRLVMSIFFLSCPICRGINTLVVLRPYRKALSTICNGKSKITPSSEHTAGKSYNSNGEM